MPERPLYELFDDALAALLAGAEGVPADAALPPLLTVARELRELPRESFKIRLRESLERKTKMATTSQTVTAVRQTATPRLRLKNAAAAIDFYQRAFGAHEIMRFAVEGEVAHAELAIGNSIIKLSEESLEYNFPGPQTLGGSPIAMELSVDDADAAVERAVAAGAKLVAPVANEFYGVRLGQVADPFGYTWRISAQQENLSVDEMYRRFEAMKQAAPPAPANFGRPGYRTVTPYIVAANSLGLVDFLKKLFGAEEQFRAIGSAGGLHCELKIGDTMMMVGGGGEGLAWKGEPGPMPFHVCVPDVDASYKVAMEAGCESIEAPADREWGERSANVKDPFGNFWYLATRRGETYYYPGLPIVQPYLHPLRAEPVVRFLKRAFVAREMGRAEGPDGVVHHMTIKVGDSSLELFEAAGPYQPMPGMFYLYVPDVDATYRRALEAGAASMQAPADMDYGDRTAAVKDIFGNQWYLATSIAKA